MSPRSAEDVRSALKRKGFRESNSDHHWYVFWANDTKTNVRTKVSHSAGEIGDGILGKMKRQMQLTRPEFEQFLECHLGYRGYLSILKDKGFVPDDGV